MAIPWMVVLQNIPWREVITNAPRVADEAKKLWTTLNRQRPHADIKAEQAKPSVFSGAHAHDLNALQAKIDSLEARVEDLQAQMLESTKLINALANQNNELVKHIEKNRARIKLLLIGFLVLIVAFIAIIWRSQ
jgi:chromosome segregation ATPase